MFSTYAPEGKTDTMPQIGSPTGGPTQEVSNVGQDTEIDHDNWEIRCLSGDIISGQIHCISLQRTSGASRSSIRVSQETAKQAYCGQFKRSSLSQLWRWLQKRLCEVSYNNCIQMPEKKVMEIFLSHSLMKWPWTCSWQGHKKICHWDDGFC
jgi:hypothetical protein